MQKNATSIAKQSLFRDVLFLLLIEVVEVRETAVAAIRKTGLTLDDG